jgi:hypothetical protein
MRNHGIDVSVCRGLGSERVKPRLTWLPWATSSIVATRDGNMSDGGSAVGLIRGISHQDYPVRFMISYV